MCAMWRLGRSPRSLDSPRPPASHLSHTLKVSPSQSVRTERSSFPINLISSGNVLNNNSYVKILESFPHCSNSTVNYSIILLTFLSF